MRAFISLESDHRISPSARLLVGSAAAAEFTRQWGKKTPQKGNYLAISGVPALRKINLLGLAELLDLQARVEIPKQPKERDR